MATPIAISGSPHWPLNSARAASTAWVSGLSVLRNCSQSGASAIGSRIPDSSSSGIAMPVDERREGVLALEDQRGRVRERRDHQPDQDEQGEHHRDAGRVDLEAERDGQHDQQDRLEHQDRRRRAASGRAASRHGSSASRASAR